jgi:glycosyltransferase involved in cell wall biosynthesis
MHRDILPNVIFAPAKLALDLSEGLQKEGADVTLFSPGPVDTTVQNITADLSYFEQELAGRGDTYIDLLKKHAFTFITLARQVQSEIIAKAFDMANKGELDIVHIYTNEEDIALPFAKLCNKPVVFTHHDPFNFLVKYKNTFPKYKDLNWISMSLAQRKGMPKDTNWVGNIYHGLEKNLYTPVANPTGDYVAYLGRIIEPKGVHLAIAAVKRYNETAQKPLKLKIAGKHYAGHKKDTYWQEKIVPELDDPAIEYVGFIDTPAAKREYLGNAKALLVPSIFDEPFGMVMIEALACGTPAVGLASGAIPEVIDDSVTGFVVPKAMSENNRLIEAKAVTDIAQNLAKLDTLSRTACRSAFTARFTAEHMYKQHMDVYSKLVG